MKKIKMWEDFTPSSTPKTSKKYKIVTVRIGRKSIEEKKEVLINWLKHTPLNNIKYKFDESHLNVTSSDDVRFIYDVMFLLSPTNVLYYHVEQDYEYDGIITNEEKAEEIMKIENRYICINIEYEYR
jgi:hypothetical protein